MSIHAIDSSTDPTRPNNRRLRDAADTWEAIPPAEFGHGATRNRAVDAVTTPLVAYLSQDAHPANDRWLSELTQPLVTGQAVAAYGRQTAPAGDPERAATFDFLYPDTPEIKTKADVGRLGLRAFHFSDVTSAFVSDVLRQVRFPEDLPTFEDIGVAKRFLDIGEAIAYVPSAVVVHGGPMAGTRLVRRYRQIGAIYERLGIFAELRRATGRGLVGQGLRTAGSVSPATGGRLQRIATAALKAGAVALGRLEAKMGRPLPRD